MCLEDARTVNEVETWWFYKVVAVFMVGLLEVVR